MIPTIILTISIIQAVLTITYAVFIDKKEYPNTIKTKKIKISK